MLKRIVSSLIFALVATCAHAQVPAVNSNNQAQVPIITNDDERAAFKNGREFVFTTGNNGVGTNPGLQVAANSVLNVRICNTSATRTWYIAPNGRFIDTSSTVLTEYYGAPNPDALTTAQAATLSNGNSSSGSGLKPGTSQTDITFQFGVGSAMTCGGVACTPSGNGLIYPAMKTEISKPRVIPPGACFGQALVGQSTANGLGTAAIYLIYRAYLYYDQ